MKRPCVFLTGGDDIGWAIDEDLRLTRQALIDLVDFGDLSQCDVVHSMWWEGLMMIPREKLIGKRIICHVQNEPFHYLAVPAHRHAFSIVGMWVTRSSEGAHELNSLGISNCLIPYAISVDTFRRLPSDDKELVEFRRQWNIPNDAYLLGNFHRDTEGKGLRTPKLAKGPDLFFEILRGLRSKELEVHVILAGPRRHWLLKKLKDENFLFTYIGSPSLDDDIAVNSLPRSTLNILYNLMDLYVVSSRWEAGPHSILEAAAAKCKIVSTPVGLATDVLEPAAIFSSLGEAIRIIQKDMNEGFLNSTIEPHFNKVYRAHRPQSETPLFADLYQNIERIPVYRGPRELPESTSHHRQTKKTTPGKKVESGNFPLTIGFWHTFFKPPYGGGNQFMMALKDAFLERGINIRDNEISGDIDAYVVNSIHFDVDLFLKLVKDRPMKVVHRIDGPIHLVRGFDREKDELCFKLNSQFASSTVLQSAWTYQRIVEMGYSPVAPVVVHNAVDPNIFHARGRIPFETNRKIRLITTSWSGNPRKGGPVYRWIEDHLDWDRFEYTFVGNASEKFNRIKQIPPVPSEDVARILREHDIFITASRNDPCSNALIEAMTCGLPVLYFNSGGHPELAGLGGLPFNSEEEILPRLEELVDAYESFQRLITVSSFDVVTEKYLTLIREAIG